MKSTLPSCLCRLCALDCPSSCRTPSCSAAPSGTHLSLCPRGRGGWGGGRTFPAVGGAVVRLRHTPKTFYLQREADAGLQIRGCSSKNALTLFLYSDSKSFIVLERNSRVMLPSGKFTIILRNSVKTAVIWLAIFTLNIMTLKPSQLQLFFSRYKSLNRKVVFVINNKKALTKWMNICLFCVCFVCLCAGSTWTLRWRPQMRCCGKPWTLLSWSLLLNPCQEASVSKRPDCF